MLLLAALLLSLLPAAIIVQHALFLNSHKTRFSGRKFTVGPDLRFLEPALHKAREAETKEFGLPMLAVRYGVPALLIAVLSLVWYFVLRGEAGGLGPYQDAMRLGALGAYVYVLLNLGQRNFQRDITSAIAVWCAATLALGPVLAGVVGYLALPPATQASDNGFHFAGAVVFFLAGLAPRYVASIIDATARRLLSSDGAAGQVSRTIPVARIRGITADIAARLEEEGIVDVLGLAMANPSRLLRNTPFDARQIVSWMDEALLMVLVPFWEALEGDGITGAIDLAWYCIDDDKNKPAWCPPPSPAPPTDPQYPVVVQTPNPEAPPPAPQPAGGATPSPEPRSPAKIAALAARIKVEEQRLDDIILRVCQDAQVQQVWVLYQTDSNELQHTNDVETK